MPEENDKKMEYLKRGEVKTMEKDLSRLREAEAQRERERIARLRVEEEKKQEKERLEIARREAEEKRKIEEEARKRMEEVRKLREQREKEAAVTKAFEKKEGEKKEELLGEKLKETQTKEEEERRKFLERVAAKAEGREEIPSRPTPPEIPLKPPKPHLEVPLPPKEKPVPLPPKPELPKVSKISKTTLPRISGVFPKRPSVLNKLWVRIIVSLFIFAILAAIATFWFWYFAVREEKIPTPPLGAPKIEEITPSPSLIPTKATQTLEFSDSKEIPGLISQLLKEDFGEYRFTRILLKNTAENRFWGLREFLESFEVVVPQGFYDKLNNDFSLFVYSSSGGINRLGFVAQILQKEGLHNLITVWEETLEKDTENLFEVLGKTAPAPPPYFKKAIHQKVTFRYLSFLPENLGICWAIMDDLFLFTSSGESIIHAIDRLKLE
jgi:hypothetical protein